ncbi:hypothetical protein B0T09DRAFT_333200, partial [Sordaria sp. MPI-SDFR-AT-0083]
TAACWSIVCLLRTVSSSARTRDCDSLAKSFSVGPDYSFSSFYCQCSPKLDNGGYQKLISLPQKAATHSLLSRWIGDNL